ncbi:MAG: choice-of-anchor L domain-containing protein, partial [Flavobacterium sp.]|nr:choice-of-anchor L domain-containing protein [Flavobacterium sp.]
MKKITLLLMLFLFASVSYGQLNENFDAGMPTDWLIKSRLNGAEVVQSQHWQLNTPAYPAHTAPNAAYVNNEQIGMGNTEEDLLITKQVTIDPNGQLRFFTKQTQNSDQFTKYQIRISTNAAQDNLAAFTLVKEWTEAELTDLNGDITVYEEKSFDIPAAYIGVPVYIAFVRVYTQPTGQRDGDRWLVDDVKIVEKCLKPIDLNVVTASISSTSVTLNWTNTSTATNFEIEIVPENSDFTGVGTPFSSTTTPSSYSATALNPGTCYKYQVRAVCAADNTSDWAGPLLFCTIPLGSVCADPIVVGDLPYSTSGNTANYGDEVDTVQGTLCGATPPGTNYLQGNEVFYSFTAAADGLVSITMTPVGTTSTNSSVFAYASCGNIGVSCLGGVANSNTNVRTFNLAVVTGNTYYIVISSSGTTPTIAYNLVIQNENCSPKPNTGVATEIGLNQATLGWTSPDFSAWQVAVQDLGASIPPNTGTYDYVTGTASYVKTDLVSAHQYQFWVRAECVSGSGVYTAWAGPYPFNTLICDPANACVHTFRMTDSSNNGWNGARMQVRQNGIVVATIGSTYNSGAGPVDIAVPLCNGIPFDLYWSVAGTQPQQCIVAVLNSFGQTIYTKPAGTGTAGEVVYSNTVNCDTPRCDIQPASVTFTNIATHTVTINWDAPATTSWDIYVAVAGGPAPGPDTVPTYNDVTTNPFDTTLPLLADTTYEVCVRVNCLVPTAWTCATFTTLPTCPKPTGLAVPAATITTTTASLQWVPGTPADTEWEILLLPGWPTVPTPPAPQVDPTVPLGGFWIHPINAGSPYLATGLAPATIYYYYVRTVCPGDDKSTWTGPIIFNTLTCDPADKCNYKFVLTDTGSNGWNGGRMQIRHNGIVIATIGTTISGAGPTTVTVPICDGVPFDVYWSVAGTAPDEIGFTIQNPFTDIIYTYTPGTGTPLTSLYSSEGNCTPPTCPKPTALAVDATSITQTSVALSWTEMGTATQWEVYAVPVLSAPPVNGSAVSTTPGPPYYLITPLNSTIVSSVVTTNALVINGLQPGTNYIYYVRAICSSTDVGTWTILNPKTFITKPVNDECAFATTVLTNPTRECVTSVNGSTLGATRTLPNTAPTCQGNTDDDVWFTFVATSTIHIITFSNIIGSTTDINHTLYQGADCTALTQLYCSNPNVSIANNLTVGQTYMIRVYTNGGNATQSANFNLCITTPPPITNDNCDVATVVTPNNGLECIISTPGALTGATASPQPSTCAGQEDDDVWYSFVCNSPTQIITFSNIQGTSTNLVHSLYHGSCAGGLTLVYCSDPEESLAEGLIVGDTYYIRVWSSENTLQDVTYDLCIGRVLPPITANTNQYTKQQLVEDILFNSTCASITDVTWSTGTDFGSTNGIGYFNKDQSEFPFADGVVLTSGNAANAPGPNLTTLGDGDFNWPGDTDLETATNMDTGSHNASILEFNFIPLANTINFRFIFASEEYGTFQCNYSDAFAFLLTNLSTNVTTNIALLPDGVTPVSVVNVRDQLYNNGCGSVNPEYFSAFYGANGINPIGAPINYNGVTTILEATSPLIVGQQYHIKLVIADRGDSAFDSAVFLEGGSFNIGNVELGSDFLESAGTAICQGDTVTIDSQLDPDVYEFHWFQGTNELVGQTGPTLLVTEPGVYTIKANYINTTCEATDSITVEFFQDLPAGTPENLVICDASGSATFDFTDNEALILAPYVPGSHTPVYFLSQDDAVNNNIANAITTPYNYLGTNGQVIYVRINKNGTSCYKTTSFILTVQDLTPQFTLTGNTDICSNSTATITVTPTDNNFDPALVTYTWYMGVNPIAGQIGQSITINPADAGAYSVTVNNSGCTANQTFDIVVTQLPDAEFTYGSAVYCKNDLPNPTPSFTTGTA